MRMDVDAPGLGKINLAINITNDQLDVRILSPNDQVRDMINKELSGLRQDLSQHGISLRNVEIGGLANASQHFGAGHGFQGGQSGQQTSYNDMKQYSNAFAANAQRSQREAVPVRSSIPLPRQSWMGANSASSRISVRV